MAITIPEKELSLSKELVRPAFAAISLTNDLFSWEKERDAAKRDGVPHVINVIWVLMRERSTTELEAKSMCRVMIKEYVAEYVRIVEETKHSLWFSLDLRTYVEAILYTLSGNLVWSLYCPRYH
jgi:Terpene synthase family 2, C-terminal metal binding